MDFKTKYTFKERQAESERVLLKYPDRIPIICEKSTTKININKNFIDDIPVIDKIKYLVPNDLTIGQFLYVIRQRMRLPAEKAIFLFVGGVIPATCDIVSSLYERYKEKDGFLYIKYSGENTFGF